MAEFDVCPVLTPHALIKTTFLPTKARDSCSSPCNRCIIASSASNRSASTATSCLDCSSLSHSSPSCLHGGAWGCMAAHEARGDAWGAWGCMRSHVLNVETQINETIDFIAMKLLEDLGWKGRAGSFIFPHLLASMAVRCAAPSGPGTAKPLSSWRGTPSAPYEQAAVGLFSMKARLHFWFWSMYGGQSSTRP